MRILAIESSCDETAAAVIKDGREVLSSVVDSQIEEHRIYGGVVPEIASRRHTENICRVVQGALDEAGVAMGDIDAVAVTYAPGLIGALLVGINFAKALAFANGLPLIPVHHLRGHIASNYLTHKELEPPFMCLVVSGGHSHIVNVKSYTEFEVIGRTRDDAAGEAFDKIARTIGFDYPGGVKIDLAAKKGNPHAFSLPHPKVEGSEYDFSFSGLKTHVINLVHNSQQKGIELNQSDVAASFQHTICEILTQKTVSALKASGQKKLVVAGGVSANSGLRQKLMEAAEQNGFELYLPELRWCGDNAAMIGSQAYYEYKAGNTAGAELNGYASMSIEE